LDPAATAIVQEHVRTLCEECKEDFDLCFQAGTIDKKEQPVWINVQDQIACLKAIKKTLAAAAYAIGQEQQEVDWRPNPTRLLARFVNRFVKQGGDRDVANKFKRAVAWLDHLLSMNLTDLSARLYALSVLAGGTAQQLKPSVRSIPMQDFFAHWGWRLVHELAPELAPDLFELTAKQQTVADYITANWSRLSPAFRTAHNRLREVRGLPTIPLPDVDLYVQPTPAQWRKFPFKKYVTVTGLLAGYVRGPNKMKFRDACLKVRKKYRG
jgi:hypothetical protein